VDYIIHSQQFEDYSKGLLRKMYIKNSPSDHVLVEQGDNVLRVTVNRPESRNALSLSVLGRLANIFEEQKGNEDIRFAIVTGTGDKAFASGGDLKELADVRSPTEARTLSEHGKRALGAIRRFPVPVIAAINGVALGGGAELALACDLRFAAAHAGIGMIHSRLNIAPSWGGGVDLMRLVGFAQGLKLLATAEILSAARAQTIGLIDDVAPSTIEFEAALQAFVSTLRRPPPHVMRAMKSLSAGERLRDRDALEARETEHFVHVWTHADHWAAVDALGKK
jgi:enoyl-CoA hydratase